MKEVKGLINGYEFIEFKLIRHRKTIKIITIKFIVDNKMFHRIKYSNVSDENVRKMKDYLESIIEINTNPKEQYIFTFPEILAYLEHLRES